MYLLFVWQNLQLQGKIAQTDCKNCSRESSFLIMRPRFEPCSSRSRSLPVLFLSHEFPRSDLGRLAAQLLIGYLWSISSVRVLIRGSPSLFNGARRLSREVAWTAVAFIRSKLIFILAHELLYQCNRQLANHDYGYISIHFMANLDILADGPE